MTVSTREPRPTNPRPATDAKPGRSESSGKTPRLIALWQHPLGEVFGTGDGKRAVMLTMLDARLGTDDALASCRARVSAVTQHASTSSSSDEGWVRLARVADVRRAGDGRLVITTPLLEGLTVQDTVASGRLSVARVIAIARQLCHALRPLHRAGLCHGALSTASVLLITDKGRKDAVRVVDVGVGAVFRGPLDGDRLLEAQPLAPEHGLDDEITIRSDIYRIGVLTHTMLTGKAPFTGRSADEVMRAHLEQDPPAITGAAAGLAEVVHRCLSKDPAARFASVDALETALCEAQAKGSIITVWDDLPRPAGAPAPPARASAIGKPIAARAAVGERAAAPVKPWQRSASEASGAAAPPPPLLKSPTGPQPSLAKSPIGSQPSLAKNPTGPQPSLARHATAAPAPPPKPSTATAAEPEKPATLEPVLTGRTPPSIDPAKVSSTSPAEPEAARAEAPTTEALPDDSDEAPEPSEPAGSAESTEATAEYRRVELSSSTTTAARGQSKSRLGLVAGGALGLLVLGWIALKPGDDSASGSTSPADRPVTEERIAAAERPEPPQPASQPEAGPSDDEAAAAEPRAEVLAAPDDEALGDDEAPDEPDEPDEPDRLEPTAEASDRDAEAGIPPMGGGQPTESASDLAAAGKRARAQGNTNEAIALFRRALAKDGRNRAALQGLGMIYFNQGDYKKAETYLKRAVAAAPNDAELRTLLGDAYFKLERYKQARDHYAKAAQRGHAPAKARLEKVQKKLGS